MNDNDDDKWFNDMLKNDPMCTVVETVWTKPAEERPTTAEEWAANLDNYLSVPMSKPDGWTDDQWREHQRGYAMILSGVLYDDLCSDWPEVLLSKHFMQAWLEAQYRGHAEPHGLRLVRPEDGG